MVLPVRDSHLTVAGVTDNVAGRFGLPGPDPHRALEGTPRPRILMAHKPELFHETAPEIDLQLSGHTHGGLALLLDQGVALFNGGFVRGWYARDDARLYVGPGSGLWGGFPLRLGVPSEILLLVLRAPRCRIALPEPVCPPFFPLPQAGYPLREHRDFIPHPSCLPLRQALH